MMNRFLSSDVGREIIARSTTLKLNLIRVGNGIAATYKIGGTIGDPFADDDDEPDAVAAADDLRFIRQLLCEFQRAEKGGPTC